MLAVPSLQAHQITLLRLTQLLQIAHRQHTPITYPHHALQCEPLLQILGEELKAQPRLDTLRSDPRFRDLVRRIGLPP